MVFNNDFKILVRYLKENHLFVKFCDRLINLDMTNNPLVEVYNILKNFRTRDYISTPFHWGKEYSLWFMAHYEYLTMLAYAHNDKYCYIDVRAIQNPSIFKMYEKIYGT